MPNWCTNHLDIRGDKTQIADFISRVTQKDEDGNVHYDILGSLLPTPQELRDTMAGGYGRNEDGTKKPEQIELEAREQANIAKYGHKNWYDWNIANWGTKWGDSDTDIVMQSDDMVLFRFDTAWSPPENGVVAISELFPELLFVMSYSEEGMDFYGATAVRNGESADDGGEIVNIEGWKQVDYEEDGWESMMEHNQDLLDNAIDNAMKNAQELLEAGQE